MIEKEEEVRLTFAQAVVHDFILELNKNHSYEYSLKELQTILGDAFKNKKASLKDLYLPKKQQTRKPSMYNLYVKYRMAVLKEEYPEVKPKDLMTMVSNEWRNFTPEEKEAFKSK